MIRNKKYGEVFNVLSASHPVYRFVFNSNNYSDISPTDDNGDDWTFTPSVIVVAPELGYVAMGLTSGTYPQSKEVQFKIFFSIKKEKK